jgi:hypothetical protein
MIEIYNPNPWMTFGGMGSKKLVGDNIEYIANNDSHPGAQFNSQFRNLAKSEITKFSADDRLETAQAETPKVEVADALVPAQASPSTQLEPVALQYERNSPAAEDRPQIAQAAMPKPQAPAKVAAAARPKQQLARHEPAVDGLDHAQTNPPVSDRVQIAQAEMPQSPEPAAPEAKPQPSEMTAFVEKLLTSANSGDLFTQRRLTAAVLKDYAERTYHGSPTAGLTRTAAN